MSYIVQMKLRTQRWQEDVLAKRFEAARNIYNGIVNVTKKRYNEYIRDQRTRPLIRLLQKKQSRKRWCGKRSPPCERNTA